MQAGDHLISPRPGFTHHGLYVGNNEVIHYAGYSSGEESGQVVLTSLDVFRNGHPCRIVNHSLRRYSPEQSVERAWSRLGEAHYSALLNNCEHFVTWCIQGRAESRQVSMAATTLGSAALSVRVLPLLSSRRPDPFLTAPVPGLGRFLARYAASDRGLSGPAWLNHTWLTGTGSPGQLVMAAGQVLDHVIRMSK